MIVNNNRYTASKPNSYVKMDGTRNDDNYLIYQFNTTRGRYLRSPLNRNSEGLSTEWLHLLLFVLLHKIQPYTIDLLVAYKKNNDEQRDVLNLIANDRDPAALENLVRDIEQARIQCLQNVNNYFDQLIENSKDQTQKLEQEMLNSKNYKDLEQLVERDRQKLDNDISKLDTGNYLGVLQDYDTREPNRKFDNTSLAVSEFLRNFSKPKLQLQVDHNQLQNFPSSSLKNAVYITNPNTNPALCTYS